jgi:RimJ/RimL family protein N-acetyltransferase
MTAPHFTFRPLSVSDLPVLHEWLNRPHVAEWWEGAVSFEKVQADYGSIIGSPVIQQYFACLDGDPVAFIQSYDVMQADPEWWRDETDPGARGIDQFLANPEQLGKGLGTQLVKQFVTFLFLQPLVTKVQADPAPENLRAIRCYEKAGFHRVGWVDTPDGKSLLMVIARPRV